MDLQKKYDTAMGLSWNLMLPLVRFQWKLVVCRLPTNDTQTHSIRLAKSAYKLPKSTILNTTVIKIHISLIFFIIMFSGTLFTCI